MFHVAEVDYTTTAGAKEGGVVQPALAVSEGAPNEKPVIEEMDERPNDATFHTVSQQNEIVAMKRKYPP